MTFYLFASLFQGTFWVLLSLFQGTFGAKIHYFIRITTIKSQQFMVHQEYEVMNTNKKYRDITYYTIISKKNA